MCVCVCLCDYQCKLITLVFGSLGHVHKNVIKGLHLGGLQKKASKKTCKILFSFSHYWEYANMETEMFCLSLSVECRSFKDL